MTIINTDTEINNNNTNNMWNRKNLQLQLIMIN